MKAKEFDTHFQLTSEQLLKDLRKNFVVINIDFEEGDDSVKTFVFRTEQVGDDNGAYDIYERYTLLFNNREYDGAFVDYLKEKGIDHATI